MLHPFKFGDQNKGMAVYFFDQFAMLVMMMLAFIISTTTIIVYSAFVDHKCKQIYSPTLAQILPIVFAYLKHNLVSIFFPQPEGSVAEEIFKRMQKRNIIETRQKHK